MTNTGRTLASRLASDQPARALSAAQAIDAPWLRRQALCHVARHWPDEKYDGILTEAVRAADSQDEIYEQVAVSAWPIRAYLERGNANPAQALLVKIHPQVKLDRKYGQSLRGAASSVSGGEAIRASIMAPSF